MTKMHLHSLSNLTSAATNSPPHADNATDAPSAREQPNPTHARNALSVERESNERGIATRARLSSTPLARQLRSQFSSSNKNITQSTSLNSSSTHDASTSGRTTLKRSRSLDDSSTSSLKPQPFSPEFLQLMESETGKQSNTLKWGTPEFPRLKKGKSTIKPHEREGNVETGRPKVNEARFFIDENQEVSSELIEAIQNVRNGGRPVVFGIDIDGRFVGAPEIPVPGVTLKDDEGKPVEAVLGHAALVGGEKLRISGEISMMPYEKEHPLYDPENPDKKRLVLINKSGRYGREGVRTPEQLLNVEALLEKQGVLVDEVIFRQKKNEEVTDTPLLLRKDTAPPAL